MHIERIHFNLCISKSKHHRDVEHYFENTNQGWDNKQHKMWMTMSSSQSLMIPNWESMQKTEYNTGKISQTFVQIANKYAFLKKF